MEEPLQPHTAITPGKRQAVSGTRPKPTILLVEDHEATQRMLRACLERQGFQIILAADGLEALEKSYRHDGPIDLLLSDVCMPRMNGTELAGLLAFQRPKMQTLLISGHFHEFPPCPGFTLLCKPFTQEHFLREVRDALTRREE